MDIQPITIAHSISHTHTKSLMAFSACHTHCPEITHTVQPFKKAVRISKYTFTTQEIGN